MTGGGAWVQLNHQQYSINKYSYAMDFHLSYIRALLNASNGIKQGSVLSSILFSIYIDDLIETFENQRRMLGA